ncbi:MAG: GNAT family N-acetyltransferase [Thermoplasmata archaeon]
MERSGGDIRISSGIPFPIFNWALQTRVSKSETDARIKATVRYFRDRGLPFIWGIFPSDNTADLRDRLLTAGFKREDAPAMAIGLNQLPRPSSSTGLEIAPVNTRADGEAFARTLNDGDFQAPAEIARSIPDLLRPSWSDSGPEPHLRCFVGYRDKVPVATSLRFLSDGVVGIYGVATIPEARRQGFGAAMTLAALEDGRARGYDVGVLIATEMGEPVYRRLGFRELYRVSQFEIPAKESLPT